jgi:hypothetical protein
MGRSTKLTAEVQRDILQIGRDESLDAMLNRIERRGRAALDALP